MSKTYNTYQHLSLLCGCADASRNTFSLLLVDAKKTSESAVKWEFLGANK